MNYCTVPFKNLILRQDSYRFCCASQTDFVVGPSIRDPIEIWQGKRAEAFRRSILNGSYRYCRGQCLIYERNKDVWKRAKGPKSDDYLKGPSRILLSNDFSCNLCCPQCRSCVRKMSDNERRIAATVQEVLLESFLPHTKWLCMTGNGDPFASELHLNLLKSLRRSDYPQLRLGIITNGTLVKQNWDKIWGIRQSIKNFSISIDGGTKQTFQANRRGAKWDNFVENMEFIGDLRAREKINKFMLTCVVQENNWREIPRILELAESWNTDVLRLHRLDNGSKRYEDDDYTSRAVAEPGHVHHESLRKMVASLRPERTKLMTSHLFFHQYAPRCKTDMDDLDTGEDNEFDQD